MGHRSELFDVQEGRLLGVAVALIAVLLVVLLLGARSGPPNARIGSPGPTSIAILAVPNVVGLTATQARDELNGLSVVVRQTSDSDAAPGRVVAESPQAGSVRSAGSTVILEVSAR